MNDFLNINYEKYFLDNGLEVILFKNNSLPITSVNLWYKVGSANESRGKTGYAHLFEHMMFQGSKNVGKEMHFKYIQEAGGTLNGSTSIDRTNFYQTVPSNNLELALWLESDRMGFLLDSLTQDKLTNQIEVVKNERRQRYENQPYGLSWEILFSNLYSQYHPYHWPTIGWMEDISNMTLEDVRDFFNKFYSPNNASLVVAGDLNSENTKKLIDRYFGVINSRSKPDSIQVISEKLTDNKIIEHVDNISLPRIYLAWHTVKLFSEDDAALDVLAYILSGNKNARLFKSMIYETQKAKDVNAFQYSAKLDGAFFITSTAKDDTSIDD